MPTVGGDLTTSAVNLVTEHTLTVGTSYSIVNTGAGPILLAEAAADPTGTLAERHWTPLFPLREQYVPEKGLLIVRTGMGIWAKAQGGITSYSLNEAQ